MHELGIATEILRTVTAETRKRPGTHFHTVVVRIGALAGVDPDALRFGFDALVKHSELAPLALAIEFQPPVYRCTKCETEFTVTNYETACPACGDLLTVCVSGQELDIAYLETEDEP